LQCFDLFLQSHYSFFESPGTPINPFSRLVDVLHTDYLQNKRFQVLTDFAFDVGFGDCALTAMVVLKEISRTYCSSH